MKASDFLDALFVIDEDAIKDMMVFYSAEDKTQELSSDSPDDAQALKEKFLQGIFAIQDKALMQTAFLYALLPGTLLSRVFNQKRGFLVPAYSLFTRSRFKVRLISAFMEDIERNGLLIEEKHLSQPALSTLKKDLENASLTRFFQTKEDSLIATFARIIAPTAEEVQKIYWRSKDNPKYLLEAILISYLAFHHQEKSKVNLILHFSGSMTVNLLMQCVVMDLQKVVQFMLEGPHLDLDYRNSNNETVIDLAKNHTGKNREYFLVALMNYGLHPMHSISIQNACREAKGLFLKHEGVDSHPDLSDPEPPKTFFKKLWTLFSKPVVNLLPVKEIPSHVKEVLQIEEKLASPDDALVQAGSESLIKHIDEKGSQWTMTKDCNFNNYFLSCLRFENLEAYKIIVGRAYGILFISEGITLYRRDNRDEADIFRLGFSRVKEVNQASTPKYYYCQPVTNSYGVSFSKKIPPTNYGNPNAYYIVELSAQHNFLLIDIAESPCNRHSLTSYQKALQEVNACDDIPAEAVKSLVYGNSHTIFSRSTRNLRFEKNTHFDTSKRNYFGCF